jgi:hypothetical protein
MSDEQTTKKQRQQQGESNKFTGRDFAKPLQKETSTEVSLTLTDEEREAVRIMADIANDPRGVAKHHGLDLAPTLRCLLERTK